MVEGRRGVVRVRDESVNSNPPMDPVQDLLLLEPLMKMVLIACFLLLLWIGWHYPNFIILIILPTCVGVTILLLLLLIVYSMGIYQPHHTEFEPALRMMTTTSNDSSDVTDPHDALLIPNGTAIIPEPFTLNLHIDKCHTPKTGRLTSKPVLKHGLFWSISTFTDFVEILIDEKKPLSVFLNCHNPSAEWEWGAKARLKIILKNRKGQREKDYVIEAVGLFSNSETHPSYERVVKFTDNGKSKDWFFGYDKWNDFGLLIQTEVSVSHIWKWGHIIGGTNNREERRALLESGEGANVVIISRDEEEFQAHGNVLADRSRVFASMLDTHMKEGMTGRVVMDDMNAKSLNAFLLFMYTGDFSLVNKPSLNELKNLTNAAEKYGFPDLKKYCGFLLAEKCDKKNALSLYRFSQLFGLGESGKEIFKFAQEHFTEVWSLLAKNCLVEDTKLGPQKSGNLSTASVVTNLYFFESAEGWNFKILSSDNVEYKAHRGILAKKSAVLETLVNSLEETESLVMNDLDSSSLNAFLRFLYSSELPQSEISSLKQIQQLIAASETYGLPDLKMSCDSLLLMETYYTPINALSLYNFAVRFNLEEVKEKVMNVSQENFEDVWKACAEDSNLLGDSDSEEDWNEEGV